MNTTVRSTRGATEARTPVGRGFSLVRWGPSFAGSITTIATTAMGMALWWGIGYGSNVNFVANNMPWFFLGTILFSLLLGGAIAGRVAGLRGARVGVSDGLIVWGLTVIAALIPLALRGVAMANSGNGHPATTTAFQVSGGTTWALFGAIAGGLVCALVGATLGSLGGRADEAEVYEMDRTEVETTPSVRRSG